MRLAIILTVLFFYADCVKLPSDFKKCNRKETNFDQCLVKAVQETTPKLNKAFPQVNLPALSPLDIPKLVIKAGSGAVAVDQNFKNCKVYNFDKIQVGKFKFDFDKKILEVGGFFSSIIMKCQYNLKGKVLLMPIEGEGNSVIEIDNLEAGGIIRFKENNKKGKTYAKFVSSDLTMEPSKVSFNFGNLFNGDKALGDNLNQVLNDNWKEVFNDVKADYIEFISKIVLNLLNNFFAKVSLEEAFD